MEVLDRFENLTYRWRVNALLDNSPASNEIMLVLLDQKSLEWGTEEQGWEWPWPRSIYGHLIDHLHQEGAKSVILDLLFTEPSPYPGEDEKLAQVMAKHPHTYTALDIREHHTGGRASWPEEIQALSQYAIPIHVHQTPTKAIFPIPILMTSGVKFGDVVGEADLNQEMRSIRPFRYFDGHLVPSLGLSPFLGEQNLQSLIHTKELLIHFKQGRYPNLPFAHVLEDILLRKNDQTPILPKGVFKDKHVFIGFSAPGLKDLRKTPVDRVFAGVEVHATVLDNYLNQDFIKRAHPALELGLLMAIAILFLIMIRSKKTVYRITISFFILMLPILIPYVAYQWEYWFFMAIPTLMAAIAVTLTFFISSLIENRQKKFIRQAFSMYLSKDVVNKVLAHPDQLKLGGERKELTIMFTDLAGFSSISEQMEPEELTSLLNEYLSEMSQIIIDEGGTLDKYEGDAIMAFWGAPLDMSDHAIRACRASIRYQERLKEKSQAWKDRFGVELTARIGIHTGVVIVGNMGSKTRFDYTVLGDAANLASRLEGANKAFASSIMVSETTKMQCKDAIQFRTIAPITVVGRKEVLWVHEPIGLSLESREKWLPWERAMEALRNQDFEKTKQCLLECGDQFPEFTQFMTFCHDKDWGGVFRLDQK